MKGEVIAENVLDFVPGAYCKQIINMVAVLFWTCFENMKDLIMEILSVCGPYFIQWVTTNID